MRASEAILNISTSYPAQSSVAVTVARTISALTRPISLGNCVHPILPPEPQSCDEIDYFFSILILNYTLPGGPHGGSTNPRECAAGRGQIGCLAAACVQCPSQILVQVRVQPKLLPPAFFDTTRECVHGENPVAEPERPRTCKNTTCGWREDSGQAKREGTH